MSEEEVKELMKTSESEAAWNSNCDYVKRKCDGYPAFWFAAIVQSGLMAIVQASW